MDLDRGALARIDRKLLAGLGQDETFQMVRVPVSDAKWSTWKRYCAAAGISMGRAIMALIDRELVSVFADSSDGQAPVIAQRVEEELASREAAVISRERELETTEEQLRGWGERLRRREDGLEAREQRAELASRLARPLDAPTMVGRNERCPCRSGLKHKHCHGLPGGPR